MDKHDVLVADEGGGELLSATFAHDEPGLRSSGRQLVRLKVELVAIERPDGLLVERRLDAGLRVLALRPNQVAATRARFRVSGGKSDRFDAFVCASWRGPTIIASGCSSPTPMRPRRCGRSRARVDLVRTRVAVSNQLRAELERFWPGPIGVFCDLDSEISLVFLERYPSPADARGVGEQRLQAFLSRQRWHPWAADLYAAARARGHDHPRAIRTVGRAWCRIVWQCWQQRTPYDPARHRALQQHSTVTIPHRRGPAPTSPPRGGCSAPPSPTRRPKGPSATRLTASRHPLPHSEVDAGRLL